MNEGGNRTSRTTTSGRILPDRILDAVAVAKRRDDVVSSVAEQPGNALAQQCLVLDEDHPHGSSAVTRVPWVPDSTWSRPPTAATRSARPASPDPSRARAPPTPSSATETNERAVAAYGAHGDRCGSRVLDDVGQALASDEVGGRLQSCDRAAQDRRPR